MMTMPPSSIRGWRQCFVLFGSKSLAIFVLSRAVVESAGNEIRSTVSLPLPGSSSLHKYLDQFLVTMIDDCDLFVLYKQFPSGGTIWRMLGFDETGTDYDDILAVADCLAESGHEVKILHAVHYKDPLYRKVFGELIGTRYYRKCPDLLVDGEFVEYESYTSNQPKNALRNMLHNGLSQSDSVIIRQSNLTDGYMLRAIQGYLQNGFSISKIQLFNGQYIRTLYKTEG